MIGLATKFTIVIVNHNKFLYSFAVIFVIFPTICFSPFRCTLGKATDQRHEHTATRLISGLWPSMQGPSGWTVCEEAFIREGAF